MSSRPGARCSPDVPGAAPITKFDPQKLSVRFACEVKGFDPLQYIDRKEARRYDLFAQFALAAAHQAITQAGLEGKFRRPSAPASSSAAASAACRRSRTTARLYVTKGPDRVSPFFVPMFIPDIAAGLVSIRYGLKGPNFATVSACASCAHAIGESYHMIRHGDGRRDGHAAARKRRSPALTVAAFAEHEGALRRGTIRPRRQAARSTATATASSWATAAPCVLLESLEHAQRAVRASWARSSATARAATPTTSRRRAEHGEGAQRAMRACLADGTSISRTWATSTPTAPRTDAG